MDLRFLKSDNHLLIKEIIDRALLQLNTAIPAIVDSYDSTNQTISATPAIKMRTLIDDVEEFQQLPKIVNIPVIWPGVSILGFSITLPISKGDSCLLIFSQRAIDNWFDRGGIQPPEEGIGSRHHDLTDAFAIFAPSPETEVFENIETEGIEIRNRDKTSRITLKNDSIVINCGDSTLTMESDGTVTIDAGSFHVNCNTYIDGDLEATGDIKDATRKMSEDRGLYNSHTHTDPQGGSTGTPSPTQ